MTLILTQERRRFLEILAAHPEGVLAGDVPDDIGRTARGWCRDHALARYSRLRSRTNRWRITEHGRAAIRSGGAKPVATVGAGPS